MEVYAVVQDIQRVLRTLEEVNKQHIHFRLFVQLDDCITGCTGGFMQSYYVASPCFGRFNPAAGEKGYPPPGGLRDGPGLFPHNMVQWRILKYERLYRQTALLS